MSPFADAAMRALRALYDVSVVSAAWDNPGYRELRHRGLAAFTPHPDKNHAIHRLTPKGEQLAHNLFK